MAKIVGPSFANLQEQLQAALDRAHKTSERAAQQSSKLLGTVEGGLGVTIAAWLQRIFEHPQDPLTPLAGFLGAALVCVVAGLAALGLMTILDQRSAGHAARSATLNTERAWFSQNLKFILAMPPGDDRSAQQLQHVSDSDEMMSRALAADKEADRINKHSQRLELTSWAALCFAFALIVGGIFKTLVGL